MVYTATTHLTPEHQQHLLDEGFSLEQIEELEKNGFRSVTEEEARNMSFQVKAKDGYKSGSGLYIPFNADFGQLRLDTPIEREKGNKAKYLTPIGAKSQALIPDGGKVITEGAKDAYAGTMHGGIPTGAIAGISHYRKALNQGSGYVSLFDNDGWLNPAVLSNLFHAGKWVNGKVQLLPEIPGELKAGLCEYFKWLEHLAEQQGIRDVAAFKKQEYRKLINSAMKPEALLLEWGNHFRDIPRDRLDRAIHTAFKLAAEYLCPIQQEQLLNSIKTATKLTAKLLRTHLDKELKKLLIRRQKQAKRSLKKALGDCPESKSQGKKNNNLERRAAALLDSGALFELISALLKKSGAVGIDEHVKLSLASCLGTLRLDRKRSMPGLFTGSSGIGKSMVLDALQCLLPPDRTKRVSGVSDAVLKRIGDEWQGKIILIDEFTSWASSESALSTLKELITRGEASFQILEPAESGGWEIKQFDVSGPIGIAACATDASISTVFGNAEEEIRSRFNELPLPEDAGYIEQIAFAAFDGLEPESINKKFPRLSALIHKAIEIAISRPIPVINTLLDKVLKSLIKPDRPLFPRLMKRFKVLLENVATLLGKNTIDLETYSIVFPLVSKVFRRSLTSANDATLNNFVRFAANMRDRMAGGYFPFKVAKIEEGLSISKATANRYREKWESLGWITEGDGRGLWNVTGKGGKQVELLVNGEDPGLPDILPPVNRLKAAIDELAKSQPKSHESLTRPSHVNRSQYPRLRDFWGSPKSHESLTKNSSSHEAETTHHQHFEVNRSLLKSQKSQGSREDGENFLELEPSPAKNFSHTPPETNEASETLEPQIRSGIDQEQVVATEKHETLARQAEFSLSPELDYSTFPHLTCGTIEAKRNKSHEIKQLLLDACTKEELTTVRKEHSSRCDWVWKNLLTKAEQEKLKAITTTTQLSLLDATLSPASVAKNEPQGTEAVTDEQVSQQYELSPCQTAEVETEETDWLSEESIQDIVECLQFCKDSTNLDDLRQAWASDEAKKAMNIACKRLSPEKHAQIKQWVLESKEVNLQ